MNLFFYILIGIITFLAFCHAYIKKEYDVSRTIVINKSKSEIFGFVRQLKKQPLWCPWLLDDPDLRVKYRGEDGYEGSAMYWKATTKIGEGTQKIIKIKEGKIMESKLFFIKPHKSLALSYIAVKEINPDKTKMVWGMRGKHKFPNSLINVFHSTDKILGRDLEKGLQNLKKIMESK